MGKSAAFDLLIEQAFERMALYNRVKKSGSEFAACKLWHQAFNQFFVYDMVKLVEQDLKVRTVIFYHQNQS